MPDVLGNFLQLGLRCNSRHCVGDMLLGSVLCIDRGYATHVVLNWITSEEQKLRFAATLKKTKYHSVTSAPNEPKYWQRFLSANGMREFIVFFRKTNWGTTVYIIGYKDLGKNAVMMQYSGLPLVSELLSCFFETKKSDFVEAGYYEVYILSPNVILPSQNVTPSTKKITIAFLVQFERHNVVLLSEDQSCDQVWWMLRTSGISSTVCYLACSLSMRHFQRFGFVQSPGHIAPSLYINSMKALSIVLNMGDARSRNSMWQPLRQPDEKGMNTGSARRGGTIAFLNGRTVDQLKRELTRP